jgi:hypothetical protein
MYRLLVAISMIAIIFAGCGRGNRPVLARVAGTVSYNGKPLARGKMVFVPSQGRSAVGKIVDGRIFEVTTFDRNDGAVVGPHKIQIASFVREPTAMEIVPWAIPERYGNVSTSGLTAEVIAGKENVLQFQLHD